jgi:hypothetical protein
MAELILSYQALLEAVYTSTGTRGHVFANDFSYVALPMAEIRAIVKSNSPGTWRAEAYMTATTKPGGSSGAASRSITAYVPAA